METLIDASYWHGWSDGAFFMLLFVYAVLTIWKVSR